MRPIVTALSIALLVTFTAVSIWAGPLTVPNTFSAGDTAKASEVNANFTEVENEVTDNANDIAENADDIASNANSITDVKDELSDKMDQVLTCSNNQVLKWNGSAWVCAEDIDTVNTDADTLDGMDSNDFAFSVHTHPEITLGVYWIGSAEFQQHTDYLDIRGYKVGPREGTTIFPQRAWAPISLQIKCTITEVQFRGTDNNDTEDIFLGIYDGSEDIDDFTPIATVDTTGWASSDSPAIFSSGSINLPYDPSNFDYNRPWWIMVAFNDVRQIHDIDWVRIYYTIP